MVELEWTFLAKALPANLQAAKHKQIIDLYVENGTDHPDLRIRQNGARYELTRKQPVSEGDASKQTETTIELNAAEFASFANTTARKVAKTRYYYQHEDAIAEFDVFEDALEGLVLIDFEFDTDEAQAAFVMPDFCLADVTQETFIAGGVLAGKSYADIEADLKRFEYQRLVM